MPNASMSATSHSTGQGSVGGRIRASGAGWCVSSSAQTWTCVSMIIGSFGLGAGCVLLARASLGAVRGRQQRGLDPLVECDVAVERRRQVVEVFQDHLD